MMAISRDRILFISGSSAGTRSRPRHRIWPASKRPGGMSISFRTERAVTVLPQPDSPTTPTVSPWSMRRSTPSTARTMPSSVLNQVFSPRMSKSVSATDASDDAARIERVAQPIADEVDGQHGEEDRRAGEQRPVRGDVEIVLGVGEQPSPGRDVGREAQPQERQGRFGDDGGGDV